ncbi:MAG: 3-deoxy-manno-octulosonate cytidylyltransferase [Roseovarius sp.]|nr:3-deoxy-manno-octulosonate cytidylyltransferase [Roseovarius sp.]
MKRMLIVIPARYESVRYPGKPLVMLKGAKGEAKSLIRRTWDAACQIRNASGVVVATDDHRIREECESFGARVLMTSSDCRNGTERCAEAHAALGGECDIVVNLQGDAPLTPHWFIESIVSGLISDPAAEMSTPVLKCDGLSLRSFRTDRGRGLVGGTTVVFDHDFHALYFSKEVIPYTTLAYGEKDPTPVHHHVGVYAYRARALAEYRSWKPGILEQLEGLEQLRFLEQNRKILCVEVEARGRKFWELNNPDDVERIETFMSQMGMD